LAGLESGPSDGDHFDINGFDASSEVFVKAASKNHSPTIAFVNPATGSEIVLLPLRMISGLEQILGDQDLPYHPEKGDSLVWGKVATNGRPLEGATVTSGDGRAIYFGGLYLPDHTRVETSANGMFAMVLKQPGWQELYVQLKDGRGFYINALAFAGSIAQVTAEIPAGEVPISLRTFDAFSGDPVRAQVHLHQVDTLVDTGMEGAKVTDLPRSQNLAFVTASPEAPYEPVRLSYTRLSDYLHIPLVTHDWLGNLRIQAQVIEANETGVVIGYVQGDDFIAEVPNKESLSKIIYFDPQGRIAPEGHAGGGFVIFNIEQDQANLIITSRRTQKALGRIIQPHQTIPFVVNATFE
jgi:hypothetical protein